MKKYILFAVIVSTLLVLTFAPSSPAEQAKSALEGTWVLKYADGSEGEMAVEKNTVKFAVPVIGELKGMIQCSGSYYESILDRRSGIDFIFGYIKGNLLEGKLQENKPCVEMKKAFKSGVVEMNSTCQIPYTAVRK